MTEHDAIGEEAAAQGWTAEERELAAEMRDEGTDEDLIAYVISANRYDDYMAREYPGVMY